MTLETRGLSDEEILIGIRARDDRVIKALYQGLFRDAYPVLRRKGAKREDIEDIVQEALIALYNNLRSDKFELRSSARLQSYLIQICKFQWYNRTRLKSHTNESLTSDFLPPSDDFDPHKHIELLERNRTIGNAIEKLGENCQNLLRLYYWEDKTLEEIGKIMNLKPASAKNGKYRCMQKLRQLLQQLQEKREL